MHALDQAGIRLVLGVPGVGQYEAVDALYQHPRIRYISLRHEQAASYMADGYARVTGELAAILVVPGPGLLYATAGISTAYASSSPMLVITGTDKLYRLASTNAGSSNADSGVSPVLQSLTKWSARANSHSEVGKLALYAKHLALCERPRPVGLEVPHTVLAEMGELPTNIAVPAPTKQEANPIAIERTAARMAEAERPLIWAGGGVMRAGAWEQVQALAERWGAPVVTTRSGKGAISDRHPLALGFAELRYAPLREYIYNADMIVAVGMSQDLSKLPGKVIRIDSDAEVARGASGKELVGDAALVLDALVAAIDDFSSRRPQVEQEVARLNAMRFDPAKQLQPQWDLMQAMRAALPDDVILVQGMNQMGYYSRNYWPTYAPRSYLTSSSLSTLGAAFPLALGASLGVQDAPPERPVVALCGDGGFLYNAQELATAKQYQIPVVAVVFNDNAYGNVLRAQEEQFDGRVIGTRLENPDFVQFAASFGVWARRVNGASELGEALREAITVRGPALIEVPVGPMDRVY